MSSYYVGLWRQGSGGEAYWSTSDENSFLSWQQQMFDKGSLITSLQIETIAGNIVYSAVAHAGSGAQYVRAATDWASFAQWSQELFNKGLYLTSFSMCVLNGKQFYAGVVHPGQGTQWIQPATDWASFSKWSQGHFDEGLDLTSLTTCDSNGQVLYGGVVRQPARPIIVIGKPPAPRVQLVQQSADVPAFAAWVSDALKKGLRLTSLSACAVGNQIQYAGVAAPGGGGEWISAPLSWADFQAKESKNVAQGYHLAAFLTSEVLPGTRSWQIAPFSCGKIDCNGATVIASADGTWSFYGSLHDESFWYGDDYALGFVFGHTSHGAGCVGQLGASISGPPVDGTFRKGGKDPWISQNWASVYDSGVYYKMTVTGDPKELLGEVFTFLQQYGGEIISLVASL